MDFKKVSNSLIVSIDSKLYPEEVVYKCFYWYGKDYAVNISLADDFFKVLIQPKAKEEPDYEELIIKVENDMVDYKLRHIVSQETKSIRELIIAKAFAYYDVEDNPSSEISDPVGYNPE